MVFKLETITGIIVLIGLIGVGGGLVVVTIENNLKPAQEHYDSECKEKLGEGWEYADYVTGPNMDKETATILCSNGHLLSLNTETAAIEATPYESTKEGR